jgi:hypothetical protein
MSASTLELRKRFDPVADRNDRNCLVDCLAIAVALNLRPSGVFYGRLTGAVSAFTGRVN